MKKRLLNAMAIVMALGMVFMAGNVWAEATGTTNDSEALTFTLDNPPSVTISAVGTTHTYDGAEMDMADGDDFAKSEVVHGQWEVNCNNAFAINFTGDSPQDDFTTNGNYGAPWFTKNDANASGGDVSGQFDHLVTTYAVNISDEYSLEGTDLWGDSVTVPDGTPANLVG